MSLRCVCGIVYRNTCMLRHCVVLVVLVPLPKGKGIVNVLFVHVQGGNVLLFR